MNTMDILTEVFRQVFDDPGITLKPETTADDVEGWDLQHCRIVDWVKPPKHHRV